MTRALPGLALAGAGAAVSIAAHWAHHALPPLVLCVGLGIVVANVFHTPAAAVPGIRVAAGPVLRIGVVLLGLDLIFPDILALGLKALLVVVAVVAITFFVTRWAGCLFLPKTWVTSRPKCMRCASVTRYREQPCCSLVSPMPAPICICRTA